MLDYQVYLLAAGNGARAGGPKAWREVDGRPLLRRQLDFLAGLFRPENVAVTIQADWWEKAERINPRVRWVAEDPRSTPLKALQTLLYQAPMTRWAFVYHVDMPLWKKELFKRLAAAEREGWEAVVPSKEGRKGHPVLLSPALAGPLLALDPTSDRLDFWLRARKEKAVELPYACIHSNWNTPSDAENDPA